MYVSVTRTRDSLAQPLEVATIAGEEMLPWLREMQGFEGLVMLSNATAGDTLVLTFWESEAAADAHRFAREQFREKMTSAVSVEVVETSGYEVMFVNLGQGLAAPGEGA